MREQRFVFGEVAQLYDQFRADYPAALVDDVLGFTGTDPATVRALEVGAGTGKATVGFAGRGVGMLALEPDADMAALARRNTRAFPRVTVEATTFEDWPVRPGAFDLLFSAQAWHWVRPDVRYTKAAAALRVGGSLALFWHRTRWPEDDPFRADLEALYRRTVPDLLDRNPGFPGIRRAGTDALLRGEIEGSGLFREMGEHLYPWSAVFSGQDFVNLLLTQSDHRLLGKEQQRRLLDAVRGIISDHGGSITVPHETFLSLARRL